MMTDTKKTNSDVVETVLHEQDVNEIIHGSSTLLLDIDHKIAHTVRVLLATEEFLARRGIGMNFKVSEELYKRVGSGHQE